MRMPMALFAASVAAPVAMPTGAIGLWVSGDYDATAKVLPNRAAATAVNRNILRTPSRLFSGLRFWTLTNVTATDNYDAGPTGIAGDATRIVGTGASWKVAPKAAITAYVPAGTYTLAVSVKSNTGAAQTFALSKDSATTRSATKTAGTSWSREFYTFTLAAQALHTQFAICSDGANAADISIASLELFAGGADLGPEALAGHVPMGYCQYATGPVVSGDTLDMSGAGGWGMAQFGAPVTMSECTFITIASKIAAGVSSYSPIAHAQDITRLLPYFEKLQKIGFAFAGSSAAQTNAGTWDMYNKGFFAHTFAANASSIDVWLGPSKVSAATVSVSSFNFVDMFYGAGSAAAAIPYKIAASAMWARKLTDAEIRSAIAALWAQVSETEPAKKYYLAEGDSITAAAYSYANTVFANATTPPVFVATNYSMSGSKLINQLLPRAPFVDAALPSAKGGDKYIMSVLIGANDLSSTDAATYITQLRAYCSARVAAGWTLLLCTILPVNGNATFNSRRAVVNADIRANMAAYGATAIVDFAADPTMGPDDSQTTNPTLWVDVTHPNAAGHAILEPIFRAVLNSL